MGRDEDAWGAVGEEFLAEMDDGIRSRSRQELQVQSSGCGLEPGPAGAGALTPPAPSCSLSLPIPTSAARRHEGLPQLDGAAPDKYPTAGTEKNGAGSLTASTSRSITLVLAPLFGRESKGSLVRRDEMTGRKARG